MVVFVTIGKWQYHIRLSEKWQNIIFHTSECKRFMSLRNFLHFKHLRSWMSFQFKNHVYILYQSCLLSDIRFLSWFLIWPAPTFHTLLITQYMYLQWGVRPIDKLLWTFFYLITMIWSNTIFWRFISYFLPLYKFACLFFLVDCCDLWAHVHFWWGSHPCTVPSWTSFTWPHDACHCLLSVWGFLLYFCLFFNLRYVLFSFQHHFWFIGNTASLIFINA